MQFGRRILARRPTDSGGMEEISSIQWRIRGFSGGVIVVVVDVIVVVVVVVDVIVLRGVGLCKRHSSGFGMRI